MASPFDIPLRLNERLSAFSFNQIAVTSRKLTAVRSHRLQVVDMQRPKQVPQLYCIRLVGVSDLHTGYDFEQAGDGCVEFKPIIRLQISMSLRSPANVILSAEDSYVYGYDVFPSLGSLQPVCSALSGKLLEERSWFSR